MLEWNDILPLKSEQPSLSSLANVPLWGRRREKIARQMSGGMDPLGIDRAIPLVAELDGSCLPIQLFEGYTLYIPLHLSGIH